MKEKRVSIGTLIVAVVVTAALTIGLLLAAAWAFLGPGGVALLQSASIINTRFVGEYDRGDMIDGALAGMVDALGDRWSLYLTPEAYAAQNQRRQNAYVGVGLTYQPDEDGTGMTIVDVVSGGPADQAGLKVGERITAVNGVTLTPENFEDTVALIAGEPGETVTFIVEDTAGVRREITATLAQVEDDPVSYEMLEGNIGYIRIDNFFSRCAQQGADAARDLQAQGAKALLFDVRSDPGGYVDELTELLDALLPEGPIFAEHRKNGPTKVITSDANCVDLPMAVLVNGDSYSAAELFAAQLRESVGAPLIGQVTCGKGYYQQALELANGGALNISTGMYTTGGGVSLIGTGLTPDILEDDPQAQMDKAVALLKEQMTEAK